MDGPTAANSRQHIAWTGDVAEMTPRANERANSATASTTSALRAIIGGEPSPRSAQITLLQLSTSAARSTCTPFPFLFHAVIGALPGFKSAVIRENPPEAINRSSLVT
jgi:hypothetical protein